MVINCNSCSDTDVNGTVQGMIHFWNDESEVNGETHWVEIDSEWGDLVVFSMGGEQVGERFSDEDPIATYAIDGPSLLDPLRFVEEGVKAEWMGKPAGPFPANVDGPNVVMQVLDFEQDMTSVTIILQRYQVDKEELGHSFAYTMPKEKFRSVAADIASMTQYSM